MSLILQMDISRVKYKKAQIDSLCKSKPYLSLKYKVSTENESNIQDSKISYEGNKDCFHYANMDLNEAQATTYFMMLEFIENRFGKMVSCHRQVFWEAITETTYCLGGVLYGQMTPCVISKLESYYKQHKCCEDYVGYYLILNLDEYESTLKYAITSSSSESLCDNIDYNEIEMPCLDCHEAQAF